MRDGSLTMRTYMELMDFDYQKIYEKMDKYVYWVILLQSKKDPFGKDVRAEPKFEIPSVKYFFILYFFIFIYLK